ncbi:MAG TPA: YceI family protein, partial [Egibacteraceae bacterium]|nr:YceI family protein [Egibacteraceae bacterium]
MSATSHTIQQVETQQVERPAAGAYEIDPPHSSVEAVARHLMITRVRGRLSLLSGAISVGDALSESSVEVDIDAASIDTKDAKRDEHMRSADFLDVGNHPKISYRSTGIGRQNGDRWRVDGELTLRGITKPVALDLEYHGMGTDPWGQQRAFFSATAQLRRKDFGITWNAALESGGVLVSDKLDIEIEVS